MLKGLSENEGGGMENEPRKFQRYRQKQLQ